MKFPICPVDMKSDILFTNPVKDRAKCHTRPTFGSILYRIGGKPSIKCQILCPQDRWEI